MVTNSSEGGILSRNRRVEAADSSNSSVLCRNAHFIQVGMNSFNTASRYKKEINEVEVAPSMTQTPGAIRCGRVFETCTGPSMNLCYV